MQIIIIVILIAIMFLGRRGIGMRHNQIVPDDEFPFDDCNHDCLACSHLDVDCNGDSFYEVNMLMDMDEDDW